MSENNQGIKGARTTKQPKATETANAASAVEAAMEIMQPKPKRVAIVGFCQSSRHWTPYHDEDLAWLRSTVDEITAKEQLEYHSEVWGLNRGYVFMERADRWFEMHGENIYSWNARRPGKHLEWLRAFQGPIYQHTKDPEIPNSVAFPLAEISANLGLNVVRIGPPPKSRAAGAATTSGGTGGAPWEELTPEERFARADTQKWPYLTSTIAYEIALAIYEGFEEIALYGIDLNTAEEYAWQKPGVEYLLGIAAGRGIRVVLPTNCPLLNGELYGRGHLSDQPEGHSYAQYQQRLNQLQREQNALAQQLNELRGALEEASYLRDQLVPGANHKLQGMRVNNLGGAAKEIETRATEQEGRIREVKRSIQELRGAVGEAVTLRDSLVPGVNHEKMDHRVNEINEALQDASQRLLVCQGALKETLLWISQTTAGQDPIEAIAQLDANYNHHIGEQSEGPVALADAILAGVEV